VTFTAGGVHKIWRWSRGLPRIVNLLCDRALEGACAQQVRTIGEPEVDAAALALGLAPQSIWAPVRVEGPQDDPRETIPGGLNVTSPASVSRRKTIVAVAAAAAAVLGIAWFAIRAPRTTVTDSRDRQAAAMPSAPSAPAATRVVHPPTAPSPEPAVAPIPSTPAAATPAPVPEAAAAATPPLPPAGAFEIVVASFKTEARASAVAAQVSDTGLPVRQREAGGWQQIIAGPFPSRDEADAARQRLDEAGLTGTHVAPAGR
jgi:general secretion pathway protein A